MSESKFTIKEERSGVVKVINIITGMVAWSGSFNKDSAYDTLNVRLQAREIKKSLDNNTK